MITANHRAENLNVPGWYPIMFRPDELSKRPHFFPPFRARPAPAHSSHDRQQTRGFRHAPLVVTTCVGVHLGHLVEFGPRVAEDRAAHLRFVTRPLFGFTRSSLPSRHDAHPRHQDTLAEGLVISP